MQNAHTAELSIDTAVALARGLVTQYGAAAHEVPDVTIQAELQGWGVRPLKRHVNTIRTGLTPGSFSALAVLL